MSQSVERQDPDTCPVAQKSVCARVQQSFGMGEHIVKELEASIRNANAALHWISSSDLEERHLGRLLPEICTDDFLEVLGKVELPEAVAYVPSFDLLERNSVTAVLREGVFGEMLIQVGYCVGHNRRMNALEYHMGSEILVAGTDLVLFLDSASNIVDGKYSPQTMVALFVEQGQIVELYGRTLHFAPLEVSPSGFRAAIVLPQGTNLPLGGFPKGLLFAKNKWLIAHSESPSAKRGACVGISGENISLAIPES